MKISVAGYQGLYREDYGKKRYRILISRNKETIQEYFYCDNYRTQSEAREAAIKRWKQIRKKIPVLTKRSFCEVPRKPTKSGIVGVRRITKKHGDKEYEFWFSSWTTPNGERKTRSFSINKHGEEKAKKMAIKARKAGLKLMEN